LIESTKLCGVDPWAYLKDVLTKLPTWPKGALPNCFPTTGRRRLSAPNGQQLDPARPRQEGDCRLLTALLPKQTLVAVRYQPLFPPTAAPSAQMRISAIVDA